MRIAPTVGRSGRCRRRRRPRSGHRRRWSTTRSWRAVPAASSSTGSPTSGWPSSWLRSAATARSGEDRADEPRSMRYSELSRRLAGVSQKMLTQTLRSLERDGMVTRTVTPTVPVTVTYELTDLGRSSTTSCAASRSGRRHTWTRCSPTAIGTTPRRTLGVASASISCVRPIGAGARSRGVVAGWKPCASTIAAASASRVPPARAGPRRCRTTPLRRLPRTTSRRSRVASAVWC